MAVGVNLLCPTHQNIALFCNLVGAMLWNGYKEKHEARFLLQGFDSAISTALNLEEQPYMIFQGGQIHSQEWSGERLHMPPTSGFP